LPDKINGPPVETGRPIKQTNEMNRTNLRKEFGFTTPVTIWEKTDGIMRPIHSGNMYLSGVAYRDENGQIKYTTLVERWIPKNNHPFVKQFQSSGDQDKAIMAHVEGLFEYERLPTPKPFGDILNDLFPPCTRIYLT
jgi:hypothetical protein